MTGGLLQLYDKREPQDLLNVFQCHGNTSVMLEKGLP